MPQTIQVSDAMVPTVPAYSSAPTSRTNPSAPHLCHHVSNAASSSSQRRSRPAHRGHERTTAPAPATGGPSVAGPRRTVFRLLLEQAPNGCLHSPLVGQQERLQVTATCTREHT